MGLRQAVPAYAFGGLPRVNLMPRAAIERRSRAALLSRWVWGLLSTVLVIALVAAAAFALQTTAQIRLALEQSRTAELLTELGDLLPVRQKLSLQSELREFRTSAMGTDLAWGDLFSRVDGVLPAGIAISGFTLSPGGLPVGDDLALEVGVDGELVLSSWNPADIVPVIRNIRALPQVIAVDGWAQTYEDGFYDYILRIRFDQSVYSGDYAEEPAS